MFIFIVSLLYKFMLF